MLFMGLTIMGTLKELEDQRMSVQKQKARFLGHQISTYNNAVRNYVVQNRASLVAGSEQVGVAWLKDGHYLPDNFPDILLYNIVPVTRIEEIPGYVYLKGVTQFKLPLKDGYPQSYIGGIAVQQAINDFTATGSVKQKMQKNTEKPFYLAPNAASASMVIAEASSLIDPSLEKQFRRDGSDSMTGSLNVNDYNVTDAETVETFNALVDNRVEAGGDMKTYTLESEAQVRTLGAMTVEEMATGETIAAGSETVASTAGIERAIIQGNNSSPIKLPAELVCEPGYPGDKPALTVCNNSSMTADVLVTDSTAQSVQVVGEVNGQTITTARYRNSETLQTPLSVVGGVRSYTVRSGDAIMKPDCPVEPKIEVALGRMVSNENDESSGSPTRLGYNIDDRPDRWVVYLTIYNAASEQDSAVIDDDDSMATVYVRCR